ncbi:MAG: hypothetical protein MJZ49_07285 [Bacteroidales bacterium]|nr:hypothetical protein [Bacteroidales bacterium]
MNFSRLLNHYVPQKPESRQVIFINQTENASLDDFFRRNLAEVEQRFQQYERTFIFLPQLLTDDYLTTLLAYNRPEVPKKSIRDKVADFDVQQIYSKFVTLDEMHEARQFVMEFVKQMFEHKCVKKRPKTSHTGLVFYEKSMLVRDDDWDDVFLRREEEVAHYAFATLEEGSDKYIFEQLELFFQHYYPGKYAELHGDSMYNRGEQLFNVSYSRIDTANTSDERFPKAAYELSQEIRERVAKLRSMGVNELVIKSLFYDPVKPSRLRITADNRILLPDYQNMEIKMGPLPKAVFFFFLRHPEGIIFKHLVNHREELLELYCQTSGREVDAEMRGSIQSLTDPLSNSINEKCSRIREAFLKELEERLATPYVVTGDKATPKRIKLPRELVEWRKR